MSPTTPPHRRTRFFCSRGALFAFVAFGLLTPACGEQPRPAPEVASRYDATGVLAGATVSDAARPNLIVVVLDTLRRDAVALPGERGGRMPYLASLAQEGISFRNACAPSPWTVPSIAGLLTGLLPSGHGCDKPMQVPRLVEAVTTFAEVLRETYGYQTASFTAGPWLNDKQSLLQGFSKRVHGFALRGTEDMVAGFARRRDHSRPFFLLLHTFEAHDPYGEVNQPWPALPHTPGPHSEIDPRTVTEPWQMTRHFFLDRGARLDLLEHYGSRVHEIVYHYIHTGYRASPRPKLAGDLRDAYEAGTTWVDGLLKRSVGQLDRLGLLDNTVLVVTSDHGEAFGEHRILGHARQLYDELVHIPLVIAGPAPFQGGRVVEASVGLIDVLPTFFDLAGCIPLQETHGRSFLSALNGTSRGRPVFCEETLSRENTGEDVRALVTGVRSARWKYIVTFDELRGTVIEEVYDLAADPREQTDLCAASGRSDDVEFDEAFCDAVEMARDRIWGAAADTDRLFTSPYAAGRAKVTSTRPPACPRRP